MSWIPPGNNPNHPSVPPSAANSYPVNQGYTNSYEYGYQAPGAGWQGQTSSTSVAPVQAQSVPQLWSEFTAPDGRKYYYNNQTKQSVWEKPADFGRELELKPIASNPWKEYTTQDGRKYYHNTLTNATTWERPPEFQAQIITEPVAPTSQDQTSSTPTPITSKPTTTYTPQTHLYSINPLIEFKDKEEAERAFMGLLAKTKVDSTWTWEQTMRAIINNPLYRALKTLPERKAVFETYIEERKKVEKEEHDELISKQRSAFEGMLSKYPQIHKTPWKKVQQLVKNEPAFKSIDSEKIKLELFKSYVDNIETIESDRVRKQRKLDKDLLLKLLQKDSDIDATTLWKDALEKVHSYQELWGQNQQCRLEDPFIFDVFETHIKNLEEKYEQERNNKLQQRYRQDRINRDKFRQLLSDLKQKEELWVRSKWKQFHSLFSQFDFYYEILGQPGSTPIEMFWDLIEETHANLYSKRKYVEPILKSEAIVIDKNTEFSFFKQFLKDHNLFPELNNKDIKHIMEQLQAKTSIRQKDEKKYQESKLRKKISELRHAMKRIDPPIQIDSKWEEVQPLICNFPEYLALSNDEERAQAFHKYIKRLREKDQSGDQDTKLEGNSAPKHTITDEYEESDSKKVKHHS